MDFTGILVVMFGMYWPFCYYSFGCNERDERNWFVIYISVAGALATMCLVVVLLPVFQSNKFHVFRPMIFGIMIIWGFTPVLHVAVVDWGVSAIRIAVILTMTMFGLVIIGGVFYMTRWPERIFHTIKPSSYGFHSHFLFHVCIVIGLVTFHVGNVIIYKWRNSQGGCSLTDIQNPNY
jgi:predicted membrane channel-forming protein YqfA (hemolysin III family)